MESLDLIGKYAGLFVTTALGSGVGAYIGSYLKKKGENLAIHEDLNKLLLQVAAVTETTKQIESKISQETWQRERRSGLQLKLIDSVNVLAAQFLTNFIGDPKYVPDLAWFSSFSATEAAVRALFDNDTYAKFKNLEIRIGPGMTSDPATPPFIAMEQFIEARNAALKAMYNEVIGAGGARVAA